MARWEPDASGRLQAAAYALFDERGYEDTSVAQIAERAGLTKRTFFRHFADKREVLFQGSTDLEALIVDGTRSAPRELGPLDAVGRGLARAETFFGELRPLAARRQTLITATPELQERELIKLGALASAVAGALRDRGAADDEATLAAETGVLIFRVAFERWVHLSEDRPLAAVIDETLAALRTLAGA